MFPTQQAPPYNVLVVTDDAVHALPDATVFIGFANLDGAAQTATISAYDGADASGTLIALAKALAVGGNLVAPAPGIALVGGAGLAVQTSAAPSGNGIQVFWR